MGKYMKYDLSAVELLRILGYTEPVGTDFLETLKEQYLLPKAYCNFMELAYDCPMLETSDIWLTDGQVCTWYDALQQRIADDAPYWEKNPDTQDTQYYPLSKIPQEEWAEHIPNLLLIGSDYGAGVVQFGLRMQDLSQDNPNIYWQTEADDLAHWKEDKPLSDFLLEVMLQVLTGMVYDVPEDVLEENGFKIEEYFDPIEGDFQATQEVLSRYGIDLEQAKQCTINEHPVFCCYDEEQGILYAGYVEDDSISFYAISPEDTESVFDDDFDDDFEKDAEE